MNLSNILIILISLSILSACQEANSPSDKSKADHLVETMTVQRTPLQTTRISTGSLEALNTVHIFNEETGRIKALPYHPGDRVDADTELVVLDSNLIQAELDKATAAYNQTQLNYKRISKLIPRNLASEDELARAKTAVDETKATVKLLDTRLSHTRIRAPFAGIISERLKEPGDVVPLHSHILTLFDPGTLIIKLHLSEILIANIDEGYPVKLRIDALGDKEFTGIVSRKYPTIDPVTRQGIIEVTLDPVPDGAQPGQLARVTIEAQTQPVRSLPLAVVRHDTRGEYVFKLIENRVRYTSVRTGIQMGNFIEIIDGLQDGDVVVSKGFLGLRDNKEVKVKEKIADK